jgi:lipopolysaccharide biosynthesis regulator YciM
VLGHLQARIGEDEARAGNRSGAEAAFHAALSHDRRVVPASLGLADLYLAQEPARAASVLEAVERDVPDRAYLTFERLERASAALREPERFVTVCERIIGRDAGDWRARLALARFLRRGGRLDEATGLLLRAVEAHGAPILHLELLETLQAKGELGPSALAYLEVARRSFFYFDPHVCVECRYRADGMLWRCPHCHEWDTFVEERVGHVPSA